MTKPSPKIHAPAAGSWVVPGIALGIVAAAVISYGRTTERQAAAGSPYYDKAVKEAINGLKGGGDEPAAAVGIPPLPDGLSAADYYWCATCKAYHRRDAAAAQPVAAAAGGTEEIPPLPAGFSAADYYWCPNCKTYHARQGGPDAGAPAPWAGVPYPLPAAATQ